MSTPRHPQTGQFTAGQGGAGSLPTHDDEVMNAHDPNSPPLAVQDTTHGAGLPAVDRGQVPAFGDGPPPEAVA